MRALRDRLTYANVVSTLALCLAVGGTSYAAGSISGAAIKNRSISASKLRVDTLTGLQIREARLGRVPRARSADRLGGSVTADRLLAADDALVLRCPADTIAAADVCVERTPRAPVNYSTAVGQCATFMAPGSGRRLPTYGELHAAFIKEELSVAAGGELTSEVYPSPSRPGRVDVLFLTDRTGGVAITSDHVDGAKAYRCVVDPGNVDTSP